MKVVGILQEFRKDMPLELPKGLPSQFALDHKIDLVIGMRPPAKILYGLLLR